MAVAGDVPEKERVTFGRGKRWLDRLALLVGVFLSLYIVLVANIISFRHPVRFDLTQEKLHTLSQGTRNRLEAVREPVKVIVPTFRQTGNPAHKAEREVLERALALLQEYMAIQPLVKIEAKLDVFAERERWFELREKYDLTGTQVNRLIPISGPDDEFRQSVTPKDLAVFGPVRDPQMDVPEIVEFRGEKALSDAILRLTERRRRPVYFTQDKEELRIWPLRRIPQPGGEADMNALRGELLTSGFEPKVLELSDTDNVPDDCELLVLAAPFQAYTQKELLVLNRYLQRGGRLFAALGGITGLENLLGDWGVGVREGTIHAKVEVERGWGVDKEITIQRFDQNHAITRVFKDTRFGVRLYAPRPLFPKGREKRLLSTTLLQTHSSQEGQGRKTHLRGKDAPGGGIQVLEEGEFPVAIAVKQMVPERPPPGFQRLDTRIVVVSASSFLKDENFHGYSLDFFMNCVAWLVGEEETATVRGQKWEERTLDMSGGFRAYMKWIPTLVFPGIFLILGAFVYFLRRA